MDDITLNRTGLREQYSPEPAYDTNCEPRSAFRPDILVNHNQETKQCGITALERLRQQSLN